MRCDKGTTLPKTTQRRRARPILTGLDEAVSEALAALRDLPSWVLAGTEMEAIVSREETRLKGLRHLDQSLTGRSPSRLTSSRSLERDSSENDRKTLRKRDEIVVLGTPQIANSEPVIE